MENTMNEIMQNADEVIVVAEEVAKFDFAKFLKAGGKVAGVGLAGYGLYTVGKTIYTKIKDKKEKAAAEAENESFESAELA